MRLAALALVATLAAAPAIGSEVQDTPIRVDRIFLDGDYITVLLSVENTSTSMVAQEAIACSVFDAQRKAAGTNFQYVERLPAGRTVVVKILMKAPPGLDGTGMVADCRVTERK